MPIVRSIVVLVESSTVGSSKELFRHEVRPAPAEEAMAAVEHDMDTEHRIIGAAEYLDDGMSSPSWKATMVTNAWRELERPAWRVIIGTAGGLRPPRAR